MSAVCPVCDAPQDAGLACHSCCGRVEEALRSVPSVVDDLGIALSKMARIGTASGGGLARERNPIHVGAMQAGDLLNDVLSAWALEVWAESPFPTGVTVRLGSLSAARIMLANIDTIRRHPKVEQLVDETTDAISQARRSVDRPADRIYVGPCWVEQQNEYNEYVACMADLYARPGADAVTCRECGITHQIEDRRGELMENAEERIVTVKQASEYLGWFGGITAKQKTIGTWCNRGELPIYLGVGEGRRIRIGDLLNLMREKDGRKTRQNPEVAGESQLCDAESGSA